MQFFNNISRKKIGGVLNHIVFESKRDARGRFLEYLVNSTGDNQLVVGGQAKTWIKISSEQEKKLCYCLEDEDGIFELEHFNITLEGFLECLECLFRQQDEVSQKDFEIDFQNLGKLEERPDHN